MRSKQVRTFTIELVVPVTTRGGRRLAEIRHGFEMEVAAGRSYSGETDELHLTVSARGKVWTVPVVVPLDVPDGRRCTVEASPIVLEPVTNELVEFEMEKDASGRVSGACRATYRVPADWATGADR